MIWHGIRFQIDGTQLILNRIIFLVDSINLNPSWKTIIDDRINAVPFGIKLIEDGLNLEPCRIMFRKIEIAAFSLRIIFIPVYFTTALTFRYLLLVP